MLDFATIQADVAATCAATFANVNLLCIHGTFTGTLTRATNAVGEYDLTGESRDTLVVTAAVAAEMGLESGLLVELDPDSYTAGQLAAQARTSWLLDRVSDDDGYLVSWWLK